MSDGHFVNDYFIHHGLTVGVAKIRFYENVLTF